MSKLQKLRPKQRENCAPMSKTGELVPLPFVDLETVIASMKMLRKFPNQEVLDNFNRATPSKALR